MTLPASDLPVILVTGGTSGLGLELVKLFLKKGWFVIATGRKPLRIDGYEDRFILYRVDFSDLAATAATIKTICSNHKVNLIVNNAGILSPPDFTVTGDGNEYTFQVNFLAHLLINEIIIQRNGRSRPLRITAITSMVHKLSKSYMNYCRGSEDYSPVKTYSDSKYFLAIMCRHLAEKYTDIGLECFSLDPGVFGSSIYRMQKGWFRLLYRIAAPFMRKPSIAAGIVTQILGKPDIPNGAVYDIRHRVKTLQEIDAAAYNAFWEECYSLIARFL